MIPNYVYFGGVYLRYLWSGVNYSDSYRSYWNARVAYASEPAEKKVSAGCSGSSVANYFTAYTYGKAGIVWSSL